MAGEPARTVKPLAAEVALDLSESVGGRSVAKVTEVAKVLTGWMSDGLMADGLMLMDLN